MNNVTSGLPDLVVVYIGGNDLLAYSASGGFSDEDLEEYRTNLIKIIDILRTNEVIPDIVLVNYYDLFDGYSSNLISYGIPFIYKYTNLSEGTALGNQVIEEVKKEKNCYLVDFVYGDFMHHCYGEELGNTSHLDPDYVRTPISSFDVHPNTDGHTKIYERLYERMYVLSVPEPGLFAVGQLLFIIYIRKSFRTK